MTPEEHKERHGTLHSNLDELVADWVTHTSKRPSQGTVMELIKWSYQQTLLPTEEEGKVEVSDE